MHGNHFKSFLLQCSSTVSSVYQTRIPSFYGTFPHIAPLHNPYCIRSTNTSTGYWLLLTHVWMRLCDPNYEVLVSMQPCVCAYLCIQMLQKLSTLLRQSLQSLWHLYWPMPRSRRGSYHSYPREKTCLEPRESCAIHSQHLSSNR